MSSKIQQEFSSIKTEANKLSESISLFKNNFSSKISESLTKPSKTVVQYTKSSGSEEHENNAKNEESEENNENLLKMSSEIDTSSCSHPSKIALATKSVDDDKNSIGDVQSLVDESTSELHSSGCPLVVDEKRNQNKTKPETATPLAMINKCTETEPQKAEPHEDTIKLRQFETLFQEMTMENSKLKFELDELKSAKEQEQLSAKSEMDKRIQSLEQRSVEIYQKNTILIDENKALNKEKDMLYASLNDLNVKVNDKVEEIQKIQKEARLAKENFMSIQKENAEIKKSIESNEEAYFQQDKTIINLQEELSKMKNYANNLKTASNKKINALQDQLNKQKDSSQDQDATVNTLLETNGELNKKVQIYKLEIEKLKENFQQELAVKDQNILDEQNQNKISKIDFENNYQNLTGQNEKLLADLKNKNKELANFKETTDNYVQTINKLKAKFEKVESENESYMKAIKSLNESVEEQSMLVSTGLSGYTRVSMIQRPRSNAQLLEKEKELNKTNEYLKDSTKNLREQLKNDRNALREQIKIERDLADKARQELITDRNKATSLEKELSTEKQSRIEWQTETLKLREELSNLSQTATDTKTTLFELAKEQQKMNQEKASKENIVWEDDRSCVACSNCGIEFGLLTRRHHCRSCGKIFCAGCTPHRVSLPGTLSKDLLRVCNVCAVKVAT